MRVIQQMVTNDVVANLSTTFASMSTYSKELSSGHQINQPSDNPGGVAYAIDLQASYDQNTQYQSTSNTALGLLQTSQSAMQQVVAIVQRTRELAVQGASDSYTPADRQAMAAEIQQLTHQLQQIGNTTFGSSYIFAGTMTQTTPFNALGGFAGNNNAKNLQISTGFTMPVNITASQVFTGPTGAFSVLNQLTTHLTATGNPIPPPNQGTATMGTTGVYSGPTQGYIVQVTSTGTNGVITGASYSVDGGTTWAAATATATPQSFTLNNGLTVNFTNGAVTSNAQTPPTVGDRFNFNAVNSANASTFAIQPTTNVGNETLAMQGTYTGQGTPNFQIRASQLDANNNVVAIQLSTDNGVTWQPSISTTTGGFLPPTTPNAGPAQTATTFDLHNGLTLTWNQSTINAAQVYSAAAPANQDTFTFTPASTTIGSDIGALDTLFNTVSGLQAQLGAKEKTVQDNTAMLQSQGGQLQRVLSTTVDVDYTTTTTQMASYQTLYQAALAVDAKSLQQTLVDFLH